MLPFVFGVCGHLLIVFPAFLRIELLKPTTCASLAKYRDCPPLTLYRMSVIQLTTYCIPSEAAIDFLYSRALAIAAASSTVSNL
jgi:hypothetical protein